MKKILVLVLVLVATTTSTFAINPSDYGVFYKLNDKSTFTSVVNYLGADKAQADYMKIVENETATNLQSASKTGDDKLAENAMNYNLYNAKCILSTDQYKKYLVLINLSINNSTHDIIANDVLMSANN